MSHRPLLLCITLMAPAACGPEVLEDSATEPGSSSTTEPMGSTGGPPASTTGPTTDMDPADPTVVPTTGEPVTCPEGQPWELLGSARLAVPEDFVADARRRIMTVTNDGRVAIAGFQGSPAAPAVLFASPTGEVLAVSAGEPGPEVQPFGLQRGSEGDLVLLGWRVQNSKGVPFFARFAGDGSPLSEVQLELPVLGEAFALAADGGVIAGLDKAGAQRVIAKFTPDSGALQWKHILAAPNEQLEDAVIVGSQGGVVLATRRDVDDQGVSNRLDIDLRGPDGVALWKTSLEDLPYSFTSALALTPNEQIIVMRSGFAPEFLVDLIGLDLASGLPVWFQTLATADATGRPTARDLIVDAEGLTIPILRTTADDLSLGSVEIQQLSFDGDLLKPVPLAVPANPSPHFDVLAARGNCGELVLLAGKGQDMWLGAFAP